jgi:hypothetical protein
MGDIWTTHKFLNTLFMAHTYITLEKKAEEDFEIVNAAKEEFRNNLEIVTRPTYTGELPFKMDKKQLMALYNRSNFDWKNKEKYIVFYAELIKSWQ